MNRPICSRILIVASVSIVLALIPPAALAQRGGFHGGEGFGGFHGGGFHGGSAFRGGGSGFHGGGLGRFHGAGRNGFGGFRNGRFGRGFGGFHNYSFYGGGYPWFGWGFDFDFGLWPYWSYPYGYGYGPWYGYAPWWGPYSYYYPYHPYDPYAPYGSDAPRDYRDRRNHRDPCDYRYPDTCKSNGNTAPVKPSNMNVQKAPSVPDSANPDDVGPMVDDSKPTIALTAYHSALRPAVKNAIQLLRAMPPAARQQRLNSRRYDRFSPEERELIIAAVQ